MALPFDAVRTCRARRHGRRHPLADIRYKAVEMAVLIKSTARITAMVAYALPAPD
jgi:hypothetical protein